MTVTETIILSREGVTLHLRTDQALNPCGDLLKAVANGKGSVYLYKDKEMLDQHQFVFHPGEWFETDEQKLSRYQQNNPVQA